MLGHVLEHVAHPAEVLRKAGTWLAPGGVICCAVPNARSLHRQAAVLMGILETEHSLNPTDLHPRTPARLRSGDVPGRVPRRRTRD